MSDSLRLADRAAVSDVVIRYATALDTRDWPLLASCLTDPVGIDYRTFDPSLHRDMPRDEWIALVTEGLSGFDVTQHLSTNHRFEFPEANRCTCVSAMQAAHFLGPGADAALCTLYGFYTSSLVRDQDQWTIRHVRLVITASDGDRTVFEKARQRYLEEHKA